MKVSDLTQDQIKKGLRVKSLTLPDKIQGTVDYVSGPEDDYSAWVHWDNTVYPHSSWYGIECECEIVLDEQGKPVYV